MLGAIERGGGGLLLPRLSAFVRTVSRYDFCRCACLTRVMFGICCASAVGGQIYLMFRRLGFLSHQVMDAPEVGSRSWVSSACRVSRCSIGTMLVSVMYAMFTSECEWDNGSAVGLRVDHRRVYRVLEANVSSSSVSGAGFFFTLRKNALFSLKCPVRRRHLT